MSRDRTEIVDSLGSGRVSRQVVNSIKSGRVRPEGGVGSRTLDPVMAVDGGDMGLSGSQVVLPDIVDPGAR